MPIIGQISVGDGATFTPAVDNDGVISWSNNKNLPNPASVDIPQTVMDRYLIAPIASPAFTGNPTAPTQAKTDNSTKLATTAYVKAVVADYLELTGGSITGDVDITGDLSVSGTITGDLTGNVTGNATNATNAVNATKDGNGNTITATYLPLAGGTMTGTIIPSFPAIKQSSNESNVTLAGGADTIAEAGAKLILYGADSTDTGSFVVQAGNSGGYKQLVGNPNGNLTWGGSNVAVMGTLQAGHGILTGDVTDISIAAKGYVQGTVNFGQTFASAPTVVAVCSYGHAHVYVGCYSVTTTGFSYIVSSENNSSFSNEKISWIAIG